MSNSYIVILMFRVLQKTFVLWKTHPQDWRNWYIYFVYST